MGATLSVPAEHAARLAAGGQSGGEVIVGVRPEHIQLQAQEENAISATVEVSELMGSEVYLHAVVGSGEAAQDVVMRIPTTDLPAQYRGNVPYGTRMHFTFSSQLVHLFDPATEKSLFC